MAENRDMVCLGIEIGAACPGHKAPSLCCPANQCFLASSCAMMIT